MTVQTLTMSKCGFGILMIKPLDEEEEEKLETKTSKKNKKNKKKKL